MATYKNLTSRMNKRRTRINGRMNKTKKILKGGAGNHAHFITNNTKHKVKEKYINYHTKDKFFGNLFRNIYAKRFNTELAAAEQAGISKTRLLKYPVLQQLQRPLPVSPKLQPPPRPTKSPAVSGRLLLLNNLIDKSPQTPPPRPPTPPVAIPPRPPSLTATSRLLYNLARQSGLTVNNLRGNHPSAITLRNLASSGITFINARPKTTQSNLQRHSTTAKAALAQILAQQKDSSEA